MAEAQGGVAQLAEKANLNRESLYKLLFERGNPELKSLDALLYALGFRLAVTAHRWLDAENPQSNRYRPRRNF